MTVTPPEQPTPDWAEAFIAGDAPFPSMAAQVGAQPVHWHTRYVPCMRELCPAWGLPDATHPPDLAYPSADMTDEPHRAELRLWWEATNHAAYLDEDPLPVGHWTRDDSSRTTRYQSLRDHLAGVWFLATLIPATIGELLRDAWKAGRR